mmetsp:Transcript_17218/g.20878  ORF Transcript_17218/g.20878 Transcript_17218/m.20878 type:complete len:139 (+) Transcript_17218:810-1226(+)|eukprot:CAMPEP_0184023354 /NCGR_PEP_ID=MMETSP0954-20121128/11314_1 /TAXON_ID=627963 /ORGANISM="Aplanochytrium sp, Strain PBS07" /LENGTH=138 /DNA_ID=CAMNT_0026306229 /DNA_START=1001 /DNA_END=1417 /DNA_ORIENTATION=+
MASGKVLMSMGFGLAAWANGVFILHHIAEPMSEPGAEKLIVGAFTVLAPVITVVSHEILGWVLGIPGNAPEMLGHISVALGTATILDSLNLVYSERGGAYDVHPDGVRIVGGSLIMAISQALLYAVWRTNFGSKEKNS